MTDHYEYEGARALVELHEERLRGFLVTWREARARAVTLPTTEDPAYADLDHLLYHVVACAGGYLTWCCEVLGVQDPALPAVPPAEELAAGLEPVVEEVLDRWRVSPLRGVAEKDFYLPVHPSRWKVE